MKAIQINRYSKTIHTQLCDVPQPSISESEVLIQVKAAAVNPLELLILTGSVKLIQDYPMPLTLGNECSGVVVQVGQNVQAIDQSNPKKVDDKACISCMRCVSLCPHDARKVNPLMLAAVGVALKKVCPSRKECELFL